MVRLTYGVLPTREEFQRRFAEECPGGRCVVHEDRRLPGDCTFDELWQEILRAHGEYRAGSGDAGDWLSGTLSCFGFEWT